MVEVSEEGLGREGENEREDDKRGREERAGRFMANDKDEREDGEAEEERVDCTAREDEKESCCKKYNKENERAGRGGASWSGEEKIEREESRGKEEITHKLGFDSEARGVGEPEGARGTAETEESDVARDRENVEEALKPTEERNNDGGAEKNPAKRGQGRNGTAGFEGFKREVMEETGESDGSKLEAERNDRDGGDKDTEKNPRSEEAAKRVRGPEDGKKEVEREEHQREKSETRFFGFVFVFVAVAKLLANDTEDIRQR